MEVYDIYVYAFEKYLKITQIQEMEITDYDGSDRLITALSLRLMLARKFFSSKEKAYVCNVVKKTHSKLEDLNLEASSSKLLLIENNFQGLFNSKIRHRLSDGTELSHIDTIFQIMYGLYLHFDEDKIIKITKSDRILLNNLVYDFIIKLEPLLVELYEFIKKNELNQNFVDSQDKAPVILYEDAGDEKVKNSPYWSNISGKDIEEVDYSKLFKDLSFDDKEIILKAYIFVESLKSDNYDIKVLQELISPSTTSIWGDFEEVSNLIKSIDDLGVNSRVRYSNNRREAFVYLAPNILEGFEIVGKQVTNKFIKLTFKKTFFKKEFKIYSIEGDFKIE